MNTPTKRHLFWHFAPANRRLRHGDGRKIVVGETLKVTPPLRLCHHGLHASYRAIDALLHSAGPIICRVRLGGEFIAADDKVVASERTVLAMADASEVLHEFACWCAERALTVANVTDPRPWRAIGIKRRWLTGDATEQDLDAARDAARDAASEAASEAAREAAIEAARAAASEAASAAEWAAAWAAEWAAARTAVSVAVIVAARAAECAAECVAQNTQLERSLKKLLAAKCS